MKEGYRNVEHFSNVVQTRLKTLEIDYIYVGTGVRNVALYPSMIHAPYQIRMISYGSRQYHTVSKETQCTIMASTLFDCDLFYMYVANLCMDSEEALVACLS